MTRLILSSWQIHAALRGELKMVLLPVKPQPIGEYITDTATGKFLFRTTELYPREILVSPPFSIFSRLWIAETWRCMVDETLWDCIEYKDNKKIKPENLSSQDGYYFDWLCNNEKQWRSPATMPKYASRMEFVVQGIGCKMLEDLTENEARLIIGFTPEQSRDGYFLSAINNLKSYWQQRYGSRYPWESTWVWTVEGEVKR